MEKKLWLFKSNARQVNANWRIGGWVRHGNFYEKIEHTRENVTIALKYCKKNQQK